MFDKFSKTTIGFVTQFFERKDADGPFKCVSQEFTCADDPNYEGGEYDDELGVSERNDAIDNEVHQLCDMVSPLTSYYYFQIWGCIELRLFGPFKAAEKRDRALNAHKAGDGDEKHIYRCFELPKGVIVKF